MKTLKECIEEYSEAGLLWEFMGWDEKHGPTERQCDILELLIKEGMGVATEKQRKESYLTQLKNEIDKLSEFLFDDYDDSVAQLGIEKVRELEAKLALLRANASKVSEEIDQLS